MIAAVYLVTSLGSALVLGNGRLAFLGPRMSLSALCLFAEVALGVLLTVALSHPVSVAWARELVGAGKARVHEHRHHEAAAGGVAPVELVPVELAPEVPGEEEPIEQTQPAEEPAEDAEAAQASEEEDAPGH